MENEMHDMKLFESQKVRGQRGNEKFHETNRSIKKFNMK